MSDRTLVATPDPDDSGPRRGHPFPGFAFINHVATVTHAAAVTLVVSTMSPYAYTTYTTAGSSSPLRG